MSTIQLDHIITFANVPNLDDYMEDYRSRGFIVSEATHRYKPGLRNRFISLGCEYVELVWVEEETVFAGGGAEDFARMFSDLPGLRQAARPFSIGFKSANVDTLHQAWTERGYALPEVWSFAPPDLPPVFSFQVIPDDLLPGMQNFALTYWGETGGQVRQVPVAPNTIYALEGVTLVSGTPERDAARWRDVLAPDAVIHQDTRACSFRLAAHTLHWMTAEQYRSAYNLNWMGPSPDQRGFGALHLLATDLDQVATRVGAGVIRSRRDAQDDLSFVIGPGAFDGLTFIIREYPVEAWRAERAARTGERLVVLVS